MTSDAQDGERPSGSSRKFVIRLATWLFVLAFFGVLYNMGHIHALLDNIDQARAWILDHGVWETSLLFFAANTLLCAFGCPRLWTCVFAGVVFGGPLGFGISLPSSILGACMTFGFARLVGSRDLTSAISAKWKGSIPLTASPDLLQTILIRQLPVPGIATTLLFAASNIAVPVFIVGSALGFIPGAAIACFLGDTATGSHTQSSIAIASAIMLAALIAITLLRRSCRTK